MPSTVNVIQSNTLRAGANVLAVTTERRLTAMQTSSSSPGAHSAGSDSPGTANVKRKVPRLAGKRQPGKTFSVNLGAKQACSRPSLARKTLPATVVGNGSRLASHGGVPPIVVTSATTNSDNSSDSIHGFDRSGDGTERNKHQPEYGATPDSYQQSSIVQYTSEVQQQQQQTVSRGMVATSGSPLSQSLSPAAGSSPPLSISSNVTNCTVRQGASIGNSRTGGSASSNRASTTAGLGSEGGRHVPFRLTAGTDGNCLPGGSPTHTSLRDGKVQLQIVTQPEQQHRARYQTEGSRGAVKDRSGNGFPVVRLVGYSKPTALQVYIGSDVGRPTPHIFYQACKVSGKNSTPCIERNMNGTKYIEIQLKPENNMTVTCDCVGILKERNVDVEYRFPDQPASRTKKKSTRCRMVFRTTIHADDGTAELLQVCSQQIICTQPPGVPEILKKSLMSCPADGGLELFVIGKNFLKDTRVVFQRPKGMLTQSAFTRTAVQSTTAWEQSVIPDKEHLNQVHLICVVPPYERQDITEPVTIKMFIVSSGKKSETHDFIYTPKGEHTTLSAATVPSPTRRNRINPTAGQQLQEQQQQQQQTQSQPASHNYFSELAAAAIGNGSGIENGAN
uniref:Nuclear factor of activated T-cells 5 n=1 Tax=Anopheles culicifacies TaxID=139723 RepID=A0A182M484_9DIPT